MMKKTIIPLLLLGLLCPLLRGRAQTAQPDTRVLSLEECREAASEHNRTLRDSRFDLEAARQSRREAFTN